MSKCIYCLKKENETTFLTREHVIPKSFGTFSPLNPTIKGDVICDNCNTKILSPLETNFIEDSIEGFYAQRLNLNNRNSVTLRNNNLKIDVDSGLGHLFFDQMLFPLKPEDGKIIPYPKTQVKFKGVNGQSYRVFFPEALKQIKRDTQQFNKLSSHMKNMSQKDLCIFAETDTELDEVIVLLKEYGITYSERERHNKPFEEGGSYELAEEYTCTVDRDIGRILAKIAVNYFAYCCIEDKQECLLFNSNFDPIRKFILSGEGEMRSFIVSVTEDPITYHEIESGKRIISHVINFVEEAGMVVARMTFFGCPAIYKIILGKMPEGISVDDFGCGHLFDPFSKEIINMANKPTPDDLTPDQIRATFGIQKRFRFGPDDPTSN